MDHWDIGSMVVANPDPAFTSLMAFYLWGFLVVFAVALTLGGWTTPGAHRTSDDLWTYFVAAMLWPLFVCAVLFVILWNLLSRRN